MPDGISVSRNPLQPSCSVLTPTVAHSSRSRLDEVLGIFRLFLSLAPALSLVSYDPGDPSWNTATSKTSASNWIGIIEAHWADLS
ncbi:MAG TPA: DNA translocase FtsK 4TM domain-containing protein [Blastocatellia bacterium]|nr:DNA translocase FtsK 4TM domain-containing protein [Blastocatellia bacterium]